MQSNLTGGAALLLFTAFALLAANIDSLKGFHDIWNTNADFAVGSFKLEMSLHHWVNDGLMAVFFFVVGLEIKREMIVGKLASFKQASLPIFAAMGGMIFPALIYTVFNQGTAGENGWGIPMATDIAFSLGVISLLGRRVPISLKIFLVALAIVDDIGAIIVLAIYYPSHEINPQFLIYAGAIISLLLIFNRLNINNAALYLIPGIFLWYFVYQSGVHATIAGVALAMCIPSKAPINEVRFYVRCKYYLDKFKKAGNSEVNILANPEQLRIIHDLHSKIRKINPLINRFEHKINPWVTYSIMPVFALANAGVALDGLLDIKSLTNISAGIFFGLLFGKPIGIFLFSYLACKIKLTNLPDDIRWNQLFAVGIIAGIGFTMSIFIDSLAFSNATMIDEGKATVLFTSVFAAIVGIIFLRFSLDKPVTKLKYKKIREIKPL
jgi:NhaA family Na+:H+ antiporter